MSLILLDSSAIINDSGFSFDPKEKYLMTSRIIAEMRDLRSRMMVDNAQILNILQITDPCPVSLQKLDEFVYRKGFEKMSQADLSLIAIAKELKDKGEKILLVSDDYSIQNMCKELFIPFESVIQGRIKQTISFYKECGGCGKRYLCGHKGNICQNCGSQLKTVRVQGKKEAKRILNRV
jgi:endoribonuclease Nob1